MNVKRVLQTCYPQFCFQGKAAGLYQIATYYAVGQNHKQEKQIFPEQK